MSGRPVVVVLAVLLIISIFATVRLIRQKSEAIEGISASHARLTAEEDKGENLAAISRAQDSWVFYRVTLKSTPLGEKLTLDCEWTDPKGQITQRNHYETQTITHDSWQTHCRDRFGPDAVTGAWTVTMSVHRRVISRTSFFVK